MKDFDAADWNDVLYVNLHGVVHGVQATYPRMVQQGFGHIVNTASMAGLVPVTTTGSYTTAKHAVVGLTRAVAIETGGTGVTVNALCPGSMDTGMLWEGAAGLGVSTDEARELLTAPIPAGRIAEPAEVARAVEWLLLDAPAYLTGAVIPVDGGQTVA